MSSVPTMAWMAPPPSPMTLRIELVKNSISSRARPLVSTVNISDTSGSSAIVKASDTRAVTSRSVARRRPSTRRDAT